MALYQVTWRFSSSFNKNIEAKAMACFNTSMFNNHQRAFWTISNKLKEWRDSLDLLRVSPSAAAFNFSGLMGVGCLSRRNSLAVEADIEFSDSGSCHLHSVMWCVLIRHQTNTPSKLILISTHNTLIISFIFIPSKQYLIFNFHTKASQSFSLCTQNPKKFSAFPYISHILISSP